MTSKTLLESCLSQKLGNIEVNWALMKLSFTDHLEKGREIEAPQYYASFIKCIDSYYGYLVWSEIFIFQKEERKATEILKVLTENYPDKPEAYIKLIDFYCQHHDYETAEETISNALEKVSDYEYYIIFTIKQAKIFNYMNRSKESLKLLQQNYEQDSACTAFLYQYGRLCIKALDLNCIGSAIGALEECLKVGDESRFGSIFYWLAKGYLLIRQQIDAFHCMKNSLKYLNNDMKKITEMKNEIRCLNESLKSYEKIDRILKGESKIEEIVNLKSLCDDVKNIHRKSGDLLLSKLL